MMAPQGSGPVRVVVVGSINMDLVIRTERLPKAGETVIGLESMEMPGGKGANQAVAAARLGADVSLVGRLGDDLFGARLRRELAQAGVDTQRVLETDCPSGLAIVGVEASGENAITVVPGANGRLRPADILRAESVIRLADVMLVQWEIPLDTVSAALSMAREYNLTTVLDPAPAAAAMPDGVLPLDAICPNQCEATELTGCDASRSAGAAQGAEQLHRRGARLAVVTTGSQGAVFSTDGATSSVIPGFPVKAVDSTAAGDAFAAALGVRLALGDSAELAVRFACAAGALATTKHGAQTAMPTSEEIAQLMES